MQPRRKGSLSAQHRSPVVTPLTISETHRIHSKSPVSIAAPIGRQSERRENTPWNSEGDLSKPRSPSSPLIKPRVEANRIIKHSPGERCANCTDSLLQLKTKDKEVRNCCLSIQLRTRFKYYRTKSPFYRRNSRLAVTKYHGYKMNSSS